MSFATHQGCTEGQLVEAVCSLNGTLRYPSSNVNAIVVSHKWYVALKKDVNGESTADSRITREYQSLDGKLFLGCPSVQIAHAYMEFFNECGLKVNPTIQLI